jgi:protein phosphatase
MDGRDIEPEYSVRQVNVGDRYLICSDGLSGVVSHQTLEETLAGYHDPGETIQQLIQLALRGGGPDNITCIVADVLDIDDNGTIAGRLHDAPVVVGAVADGQLPLHDQRHLQTPAGRASELGRRPQAPEGAFGPPGSGDLTMAGTPIGSFGDYENADFDKPRRKGRWLKRSAVLLLVMGVIGGGLYGAYRWTQTQYYIGANGDHAAIYQGIDQKLAWINLSKVYEDRTDIELKYLPEYQRNSVTDTVTAGNLADARKSAGDYAKQAKVCQTQQAIDKAKAKDATTKKKTVAPSASGAATVTPTATGTPSTTPTPTASSSPSSSPTLSEDDQKLAQQCPSGQ